jgi:hypothetical protein
MLILSVDTIMLLEKKLTNWKPPFSELIITGIMGHSLWYLLSYNMVF